MTRARILADLGGVTSSATELNLLDGQTDLASQAELDAAAYNDNAIQTNIALLGFKVAVNGSLAKYDLQDQIIDEYETEAGVNTGDSTNQVYTTGVCYSGSSGASTITGGDSTDTSVSGYTTLVFTTSRALTVTSGGDVSILVVGGGGSGGSDYGGGGGAGGLVYDADYAVTANTYDAVIGAGGTPSGSNSGGNVGGDSTWTINTGSVMQFTAKGGGGGGSEGDATAADDGGSGGGAYYASGALGDPGATTQNGTTQGETPDVSIGYIGGTKTQAPDYNSGGGGGAGGAGGNATGAKSGDGGLGYDARTVFGTAVGDGGWFASGGGGAYTSNGNSVGGTSSSGGGGDGALTADATGVAGQVNTGGGSGGGSTAGTGSLVGGTGVILVRYTTADFTTPNDLTLQSTDTTAEAAPTKADMVMLVEDAGSGVASLDTSSGNIKGWVSMYETGGTKTWTQVPLVDEGHWGTTDKRILAAHDVTLTGTSGTQMAYKITTHSASAVYDTKIHATSIGWR